MFPKRPNHTLVLAGLVAALGAFAPALGRAQARLAPNQPGERLLPPTPSRPCRLGPGDLSKLQAAADKRDRRMARNSNAVHAGGWVSTQAWLNRLDAFRLQ